MEQVDVDGVRIAYTQAGSGRAVVLLHGSPCDSRSWQWVAEDLAQDHTVIAWDAPGYGRSSDVPESCRAPHYGDAFRPRPC